MQSGEWRVKQCNVLRFSAFTLWCQFVGKLCTFMSSHGVGVLSLCWLSCQKLPLLQHNYRTASPSCFTTSFFISQHRSTIFTPQRKTRKWRSEEQTHTQSVVVRVHVNLGQCWSCWNWEPRQEMMTASLRCCCCCCCLIKENRGLWVTESPRENSCERHIKLRSPGPVVFILVGSSLQSISTNFHFQ